VNGYLWSRPCKHTNSLCSILRTSFQAEIKIPNMPKNVLKKSKKSLNAGADPELINNTKIY